jgi:hypothetical protein
LEAAVLSNYVVPVLFGQNVNRCHCWCDANTANNHRDVIPSGAERRSRGIRSAAPEAHDEDGMPSLTPRHCGFIVSIKAFFLSHLCQPLHAVHRRRSNSARCWGMYLWTFRAPDVAERMKTGNNDNQ